MVLQCWTVTPEWNYFKGRRLAVKVSIYDTLTDDGKAIRKKVFMDEQGFRDEFDEIDKTAAHFVLYDDGLPIAACRVFFDKEMNAYTLGRLAVLREYRGKDIGSVILKEAEEYVKSKGGKSIVLHAQCRVSGFYKKLSYMEFGSVENEQGCPHIWMRKLI